MKNDTSLLATLILALLIMFSAAVFSSDYEYIAGSATSLTNVDDAKSTARFCVPIGRGKAEITMASFVTDTNFCWVSYYVATNFIVITNNGGFVAVTNYITGSTDDGTKLTAGTPLILEDASAGKFEWNEAYVVGAAECGLTNTTSFIPSTNDRIWVANLVCRYQLTNVNWTRIGGPLFVVPQGYPGMITLSGHSTSRIDAVIGTYRRP